MEATATVYRCESTEHRGRWIVQTYHYATGMPWADQECPHYQTRAEARAAAKEA